MTSGTQILAAQYVTIQDKAQSLLGTGSETRGYGQTVQSADVFTGNAITKAQWDLLRYDIINIRLHQDGTLPNIASISVGDPIGYGAGSPNSNFDSLLETAIANRFRLDTSQAVITAKGSATYTSPWSTSLSATLTLTFADSNEARYFFNSGGKIRFTTSLTGSTVTPQYTAWVNILNSIGTRSFGADTDPLITYYTLTNTFQTYYANFAFKNSLGFIHFDNFTRVVTFKSVYTNAYYLHLLRSLEYNLISFIKPTFIKLKFKTA